MSTDAAAQPERRGTYSASIGMLCLVLLCAAWAGNDFRMVEAVNASRNELLAVSQAFEPAGAPATPAQLDAARSVLAAVAASEGGVRDLALFDLLAREETRRFARTTTARALARLAQSEVFRGDLPAALRAAQVYEERTEDDLIPGEVDAWVWRVRELAEHPAAQGLDPPRLRRALFAELPLDQALAAPGEPPK